MPHFSLFWKLNYKKTPSCCTFQPLEKSPVLQYFPEKFHDKDCADFIDLQWMRSKKMKWIGWDLNGKIAWITPSGMMYNYEDLKVNDFGKQYLDEVGPLPFVEHPVRRYGFKVIDLYNPPPKKYPFYKNQLEGLIEECFICDYDNSQPKSESDNDASGGGGADPTSDTDQQQTGTGSSDWKQYAEGTPPAIPTDPTDSRPATWSGTPDEPINYAEKYGPKSGAGGGGGAKEKEQNPGDPIPPLPTNFKKMHTPGEEYTPPTRDVPPNIPPLPDEPYEEPPTKVVPAPAVRTAEKAKEVPKKVLPKPTPKPVKPTTKPFVYPDTDPLGYIKKVAKIDNLRVKKKPEGIGTEKDNLHIPIDTLKKILEELYDSTKNPQNKTTEKKENPFDNHKPSKLDIFLLFTDYKKYQDALREHKEALKKGDLKNEELLRKKAAEQKLEFEGTLSELIALLVLGEFAGPVEVFFDLMKTLESLYERDPEYLKSLLTELKKQYINTKDLRKKGQIRTKLDQLNEKYKKLTGHYPNY